MSGQHSLPRPTALRIIHRTTGTYSFPCRCGQRHPTETVFDASWPRSLPGVTVITTQVRGEIRGMTAECVPCPDRHRAAIVRRVGRQSAHARVPAGVRAFRRQRSLPRAGSPDRSFRRTAGRRNPIKKYEYAGDLRPCSRTRSRRSPPK